MKNKVFWFDVETLSFDGDQSDIIQLAGMIEIDGKIVEKFSWWVRPDVYDDDKIIPGIWDFHKTNINRTKEQILTEGISSKELYDNLIEMFSKYVDKYDRNDKFVVGGYNVMFDVNKLNGLFKFHGDNYMFSFLSSQKIDPMYLVPFVIPDYPHNKMKLVQMWEYLIECGMEVPEKIKNANAHEAFTDVVRTYMIYKKFCVPVKEAIANEFTDE